MADNKTIQKIFSLSDYRRLQLTSKIPERTRETYREFGYFGGGYRSPATIYSSIQRFDYSNDTSNALIRGPLSSNRYSIGATSNSNFGYFNSGSPGFQSTVDRIDYSNDSAASSVRGPLTYGVRNLNVSVGNLNFGYFGGGHNPSVPTAYTIVNRIDYSNDTATASVKGPLSLARSDTGNTGNSNFGYSGGGINSPAPAIYSRVDRIDYSNDTATASVRGPLSLTRRALGATGNSNFGYFGGGGLPGPVSTIDRIDYSNDTSTASGRGPLSYSKSNLSASGNSNFGYFYGGSAQTIIDRIDYSNDTAIALVRGRQGAPNTYTGATSSHNFGGTPNSSFASNFTFPTVPNAGYFGGGSEALASIDKVDYANDTATASVRSALSVGRRNLAATGNSNFGYFGGGQNTPQLSIVDRIEYSSDTQSAVVRGPINSISIALAATGNSNFGYFGGGNPGGSAVDRIDYSNDSTTASVRGPLSEARRLLAAIGNSNFGYFGGGLVPGSRSTVDRIDYSNDTATASVRGPLSQSKYNLKATGNSNFGYFGGGQIVSTVDRIDYSNDTSTSSVRGSLSQERVSHAATGNSNFGYFGGGNNPGVPVVYSTVNRIDYSNDTQTASVRGPLPIAKSLFAATSPLAYGGAPIYFTNPLPQVFQDQIEFDDSNTLDLPFKRVLGSFGYYGGGGVPFLSTVDRIDYSNDLIQASVRGPLSSGRRYLSATGNSNFGYFGGGRPNPSPRSTVERIDYSNDNAIALLRGPLSSARQNLSGFSNPNFGYFAGGSFPTYSTIDRLDYSNDNINLVKKSNLSLEKGQAAATGNSNFGYFGGGSNPPAPATYSTIDRLDYSNDIATTSIRGPLSSAKSNLAATGNSNFGYFGGGNPGPVSTVDRIDYSNDTATASVRGPLSIAGFSLTATGNSNFGYFGNAYIGTKVDRIDYSNDTATASVRGPLTSSRFSSGATTNARNS